MLKIQIARLFLELAQPLPVSQAHLVRGYLARLFYDYDLAHNHDLQTHACQYRYPLIQYKIVAGQPLIMAIGEQAIVILQNMWCYVRELKIRHQWIAVHKSRLEVHTEDFGISPAPLRYHLISPWIALNSKNAKKYYPASESERQDILQHCFIGNLLSISKFMNYTVPSTIEAQCQELNSKSVILKGKKMIGFRGNVVTNFYLPDFIGIGKSCSRGYGCIQRADITAETTDGAT